MRCCVDEVREGDERGGETDGWAVQGCDQDLGMCVESVCDVEIVADERLEEVSLGVAVVRGFAGDGHVGAAVEGLVEGEGLMGKVGDVRREEAPIAGQDSDVNIVASRNLVHELCDAVVEVLGHSIELLWEV